MESEEGKGSRFWFKISLKTADIRPLIDKRIFRGEDYSRLPAERKKVEDIRVLIAEDYPQPCLYAKTSPAYGIKKYDIAENGKAAFEATNKNSYDMILMDCHMPIMSGYEATIKIREREKQTGDHILIIAMSADAMLGTRGRCLTAGMDDYISKPVNPNELHHILARWLTFQDEAKDSKKEGVIDLAGLKQYADNEEELNKFVDMFFIQSEEILKILQDNCANGENEEWTEAAHKLRGGAGMLKAKNPGHL